MFRLYSDNVITKGYNRDLLQDFCRGKITIIPKEVTAFIESLENGLEIFSKEEQELLDELTLNEIVFELSADEVDLFPKLNLDWDHPATISNAAIEITSESILNIPAIFEELAELNCFYYSVILKDVLSDKEIDCIYTSLTNCSIISFELTLNYFKSEKLNEFLSRCVEMPRLKNKITVFNCQDKDFIEKFKMHIQLKAGSYNKNSCGCIKKENFNCNLHLYSESQQHNTCLNRKISIDGLGNIKNCLSMSNGFGNIKETKLEEAIGKKDFKKLWNIKKDDILVCRDCEFRHMCTDCRAFVENPGDIYSKPLKCGYDPYTNVWEEWSTNPIKQKVINFYGMNESVTKTNV